MDDSLPQGYAVGAAAAAACGGLLRSFDAEALAAKLKHELAAQSRLLSVWYVHQNRRH